MFKRMLSIIFTVFKPSLKPVTTLPVVAADSILPSPQQPFITKEFLVRYETALAAAEAEKVEAEQITLALKIRLESLAAQSGAAAELKRRELMASMQEATKSLGQSMMKIMDLREKFLAEEKQYLLDKKLELREVFRGDGYEKKGNCSPYKPEMYACWLSQRRIVEENGEYFLIEVRRYSSSTTNWVEPYGPEVVAWSTSSVDQMTTDELRAIARDQKK